MEGDVRAKELSTPELLEVLERVAIKARRGVQAVDTGRHVGRPVNGRTALAEIAVTVEDVLEEARQGDGAP